MAEDLSYERLYYLSGEVLNDNGKVKCRYQNPHALNDESDKKWDVWVDFYLKPQLLQYEKNVCFKKPIPMQQFITICRQRDRETLDELLGEDILYSS